MDKFAGLTLVGVAVFALAPPLTAVSAVAAGSHTHGHHHFEFGAPGDAADVSRTIRVALEDTYFEPQKIRIKAGETVRFLLRNNGELVHEFNIGTPHMHEEHRAEMQMMVDHGVLEVDKINHEMMKMDMGGGHTMAHDDPNSALLEPGGEAEIIWTFVQPMELEFACNVPGHYDAGMAGPFEFVRELTDK